MGQSTNPAGDLRGLAHLPPGKRMLPTRSLYSLVPRRLYAPNHTVYGLAQSG